eukprot:m.116407 g.116407  ORF g.116407 m.116407 type:complete len:148 (-) comp12851_c2_seq13:1835-2278(-)
MKSSAMNISACHGLCYFNLVLDTADINNLPSTPIERATLACEKGTELGLPMLLSPADLIADHLDDISATTFVAELREDYDVAKENAPAPPKKKLVITVRGPKSKTNAEEGNRSASFNPLSAGGKYNVTITFGSKEITKPGGVEVNNK